MTMPPEDIQVVCPARPRVCSRRVLEFGTPDELRRREGSSFAAMLSKEAHGVDDESNEFLG